jgi:hypothetical protein
MAVRSNSKVGMGFEYKPDQDLEVFKSTLGKRENYNQEWIQNFGKKMPASFPGYIESSSQRFLGYHGTDEADSILRSGFKDGKANMMLGPGVYTTPSFSLATGFAKRERGGVLAVFIDGIENLSLLAFTEDIDVTPIRSNPQGSKLSNFVLGMISCINSKLLLFELRKR